MPPPQARSRRAERSRPASRRRPSGGRLGVTCCQANRNRMNSAGVIGSMSARRRVSVSRWIRASSRRSHHCSRAPTRQTLLAGRRLRIPTRATQHAPSRPDRPTGNPSALGGQRPEHRHAALQQFGQRRLLCPQNRGAFAGCLDRRGKRRRRKGRAQFGKSFGSDPERTGPRVGRCLNDAGARPQLGKPTGPSRVAASLQSSVKNPAVTSASCSSSGSRGSGHASSVTLAMTSGSSSPRPPLAAGSVARRA